MATKQKEEESGNWIITILILQAVVILLGAWFISTMPARKIKKECKTFASSLKLNEQMTKENYDGCIASNGSWLYKELKEISGDTSYIKSTYDSATHIEEELKDLKLYGR